MELVVALCTFIVCCYVLVSLSVRWLMRRDRHWRWASKDGGSSVQFYIRTRPIGSGKETA